MLESLLTLNPVLLSAIAGLFTWGCTALGAALVFPFRHINQKILSVMNGFAAGVMIAASFWSLLAPAIQFAEEAGYGKFSFVPAAIGFLLGGMFLRFADAVIPHQHSNVEEPEGPKVHAKRSSLLFFAVTLHNIPEGMALGVAFGAAAYGLSGSATIASALGLTLGIGLQNIPEGAALSMPLRAAGASRKKAFQMGQLSGIVEPIGAIIGAWIVVQAQIILPYALAFAAGAMIFVVAEELIPESQSGDNGDIATTALLVGFTVMMILDVALG